MYKEKLKSTNIKIKSGKVSMYNVNAYCERFLPYGTQKVTICICSNCDDKYKTDFSYEFKC